MCLSHVLSNISQMNSKVFKELVALLLVLNVVACKKNDDNDKPLLATEILDFSYGAHEQNTMDVYLPAGRSDTTRVIILVHGGSWAEGDKEDLTEFAVYYRDKGFAVVNMNYRLVGTPEHNIHPAQQNDIDSAVRLITSKALDWRVSRDRFGLVGASAGAHLALLYTYANNASNKIKTVVSLAGPTNFTDTEEVKDSQKFAVQRFMGLEFNASNLQSYINASPISKVNSLSKPTLLIHGLNDDIVPIKQSRDLKTKLDQSKVTAELMELPDAGHEIFTDTNRQQVLDKIEDWLEKYIN